MKFPPEIELGTTEEKIQLALWITLASDQLGLRESTDTTSPRQQLLSEWDLPDPRDARPPEYFEQLKENNTLETLSKGFAELPDAQRGRLIAAMEQLIIADGEIELNELDTIDHIRRMLGSVNDPESGEPKRRKFEVPFNHLPLIVRQRLVSHSPPSDHSSGPSPDKGLFVLILVGLCLSLSFCGGMTLNILDTSSRPPTAVEISVACMCLFACLWLMLGSIGVLIAQALSLKNVTLPYSPTPDPIITGQGLVRLLPKSTKVGIHQFSPSNTRIHRKTIKEEEIISRKRRPGTKKTIIKYKYNWVLSGWEIVFNPKTSNEKPIMVFAPDKQIDANTTLQHFYRKAAEHKILAASDGDLTQNDPLHEARVRSDWGPLMKPSEDTGEGPLVVVPESKIHSVLAIVIAFVLSGGIAVLVSIFMFLLNQA